MNKNGQTFACKIMSGAWPRHQKHVLNQQIDQLTEGRGPRFTYISCFQSREHPEPLKMITQTRWINPCDKDRWQPPQLIKSSFQSSHVTLVGLVLWHGCKIKRDTPQARTMARCNSSSPFLYCSTSAMGPSSWHGSPTGGHPTKNKLGVEAYIPTNTNIITMDINKQINPNNPSVNRHH